MPRKKVEKEAFIPTEMSPKFFKAFMFKDQTPDMIVDTSGDTFSMEAGDAVWSMFDHMSQSDLMLIPERIMMIGEDQVAYDHDLTNPNMGKVVVIQLRAHDNEQFEAAKSDVSAHDFTLELRNIPAGYTVALQEYTIRLISMEAKGPNAPFEVKRCELVYDDPNSANDAFPDTIILF